MADATFWCFHLWVELVVWVKLWSCGVSSSVVKPDFGPKIRVESGQVGSQDQKRVQSGPIGSGWPLIGFKFRFNPIMYLINPNEPDLNPISYFGSGWAPRVQIRAELGGVGRVHLAALDLISLNFVWSRIFENPQNILASNWCGNFKSNIEKVYKAVCMGYNGASTVFVTINFRGKNERSLWIAPRSKNLAFFHSSQGWLFSQ